MMQRQYLHIQCEDYSLLALADDVERVVAGHWQGELTELQIEQENYPCMNLLLRLTANQQSLSRHCIIFQQADSVQRLAVLVGRVHNVEAIDEDDFDDLPNLDFPFNDYFDKVYLQPTDKRCIYRLKPLFFLVSHDN
jgi:hypothetical protein